MRGAIGFSARSNPLSWLIRWATRSEWSHVFIVLSKEIGPTARILHASGFSVHESDLEPYLQPGAKVAIYQVGGTEEQVEKAIGYAQGFEGESYGWFQLLTFIPALLFRGIRNPSSKGVVCSELAWRYANALNLPGIAMLDRDTVSPGQMFQFFGERGAVKVYPK